VGRPRKLAPDQLDMAAQLMADRSLGEVEGARGVAGNAAGSDERAESCLMWFVELVSSESSLG